MKKIFRVSLTALSILLLTACGKPQNSVSVSDSQSQVENLPGVLGNNLASTTPVVLAPVSPAPELIAQCTRCHGNDGDGINPFFARIGGQQEKYLALELKAFRDCTVIGKECIRAGRDGRDFMYKPTDVSNLSDQDIVNLSHYFATRPQPQPVTGGDANLIAQGKDIYMNGVGDDVQSCVDCHGAKGLGNGNTPALSGQFDRETIKQMANYKNKRRKNTMMVSIALSLSDDQVKALAAYLSSL